MERHEEVGLHRVQSHFEHDVRAQQLIGSPLRQHRVLRDAVAADAEARVAHVVVRPFANSNRVDDGEQVDSGPLRQQRPLGDEGDVHRAIRVFEQLCHLAARRIG